MINLFTLRGVDSLARYKIIVCVYGGGGGAGRGGAEGMWAAMQHIY